MGEAGGSRSFEAPRQSTSPPWSPGNLRHSPDSSLVLLPSGPDTVRRSTMHRARAPWRAPSRLWRRGRDSNPRWSYPHTRFPSVLLRPLGHLSVVQFSTAGGEEGIRTLGPRERSTVFETAPIDHSGTSPHGRRYSTTDCRCLAKKSLQKLDGSLGLEAAAVGERRTESGVFGEIDHRSAGPGLGSSAAPDDQSEASLAAGCDAHGAGFQRDIERAFFETPVADGCGRLPGARGSRRGLRGRELHVVGCRPER